jgi:tRNA A-37 threonylcarbamoyl transferase component Bud32/thioredoxin-like negative regulator of GroEL
VSEVPERLSAALSGHYRIERELGAGGMATVYLAEDLKHRRRVAVKVLRSELTASLGSERFLREVTIAANLQHPHILPLYDSGEAGGFLYYVMPYVEGPSLRQKLIREGELPITDAVRMLRDVADAMAYAHRRGVVQRDIKPENVMLSERHALVTDFGVAKAVSEATGRQTLTTAGVALGTPAYMSPEQATADPHTDHRADIYAFGVMAYEILTGRTPFTGASPQAVLAAHVTSTAEPVTSHRASIPPVLATLVMRCLEKKPADRWQTADELIPQLEAALTPSGGITPTETVPIQAFAAMRFGTRGTRIAITGGMLLLVGLTTWILWPGGMRAPAGDVREPVVVIPFEVRASDPVLRGLGAQAADQITGAIEQATLGKTVSYGITGQSDAFSPELARKVIKSTGAATLVSGVIAQRGDSVVVQARVTRAGDLQTIWTLGPEVRSLANASTALDAIQARVLGALGVYVSRILFEGANPSLYQPPSTLASFRLAEKGISLFNTAKYAESLPLLVEAAQRDSAWLSVKVDLVSNYWNTNHIQERDSLIATLKQRRSELAKGDALHLDYVAASALGSPEDEYNASQAWLRADSEDVFPALRAAMRANRPEAALRYYQHYLEHDSATSVVPRYAWEALAADAYHQLGQFDKELALVQAPLARDPGNGDLLRRVSRALAAMGRVDSLEALINQSYASQDRLAPGFALLAAVDQLSLHGHAAEARRFAERGIAWAAAVPEELRYRALVRNLLRGGNRILGHREAILQLYAEDSRRAGQTLGSRALALRYAVFAGDTSGALQFVDSLRAAPFESFMASFNNHGAALYWGAEILALLGHKEAAVGMLREALNRGWRLGVDESMQWYWEPIKDYPPFQELVRFKR